MKTFLMAGFLIFVTTSGSAFEALPECGEIEGNRLLKMVDWIDQVNPILPDISKSKAERAADAAKLPRLKNQFDAEWGEGCFDAIRRNKYEIKDRFEKTTNSVKLRPLKITRTRKREICREHYPDSMVGSQEYLIKKISPDYVISYEGIKCQVYHQY